jgi:hypothetical protein
MWRVERLLPALLLTVSLAAQTPPETFAPRLLPGEGLSVAGTDRVIQSFGEARREFPMGSLAMVAWLRLEGNDWAAQSVTYKCTGRMGAFPCWSPKGHGKLDLAKATQESCNLAYLTWVRQSAERWKKQIGAGAGRAFLEETFRPFLGNRLPPGDAIPEMTPAWIGDGDLLRTSPEAMLEWLLDPNQDQLLSLCRRLLLGSLRDLFQGDVWWMKAGTAPVPSEPGADSAWVVGSDGRTIAVLHLPRGRGKAEGVARFQALMGIPAKP